MHRTLPLALPWIVLLAACPVRVPPPPADTGPIGDPELCWEVAPGTCDVHGCDSLVALPVQEVDGGFCVDWDGPEPVVGCMPPDTICAQVLTWAAPPGDPEDCHAFRTACQPADWIPCADASKHVTDSCD